MELWREISRGNAETPSILETPNWCQYCPCVLTSSVMCGPVAGNSYLKPWCLHRTSTNAKEHWKYGFQSIPAQSINPEKDFDFVCFLMAVHVPQLNPNAFITLIKEFAVKRFVLSVQCRRGHITACTWAAYDSQELLAFNSFDQNERKVQTAPCVQIKEHCLHSWIFFYPDPNNLTSSKESTLPLTEWNLSSWEKFFKVKRVTKSIAWEEFPVVKEMDIFIFPSSCSWITPTPLLLLQNAVVA